MATDKYLNLEGLEEVASKVNLKLRTVLTMPASPEKDDIVLYKGVTTNNYIRGNIYMYEIVETYYKWTDGSVDYYTLAESPATGDTVYSDTSGTDSGFTVDNFDSINNEITISGNVYGRDEAGDTDILNWILKNTFVKGYYNEANDKFYEEDTYTTEISGHNGLFYVTLDTNCIYRYDEINTKYILIDNNINLNIIAPIEKSPSAHAYAKDDQLIYQDFLYTATQDIAIGDELSVGTNLQLSPTITDQLANTSTADNFIGTQEQWNALTPEQQAQYKTMDLLGEGGGGTSGGHTIIDEEGTSLPQRGNLQFIGASVTDDETNGTTVVEIENDVNLDIIAPTEVSPSTHAYEVGEQFIYNDNLYKVTNNIAIGDNIVPEESTPTVVGAITLYEQATTPTDITKVVIDDVEYTTFSDMPVKEGSHVVFYHDSSRGWYFDPYDSSTYIGNRNLGVGEACYFDVPTGISGTLTLYVYPFTNNDITYDTLNLEASQGWIGKKEEVIPVLGEGSYTPITFNCTLSSTIVDQLDDKVETVGYEEDIYGIETPNPQSIQNQITNQTNVLGAKNLIPYPYKDGDAKTKNGITFSCDTDGIITANGTATGTADYIFTNTEAYSSLVKLKNGSSYTLSGCPNNGSAQSYYIRARIYQNDINNIYATINDYGSGVNIEIPNDSNVYYTHIYIHILSEQTVTNLIFKPMLRLASDPNNIYAPYAMTNRELTEDVQTLDADVGTLKMNLKATYNSTEIPFKFGIDASGNYGYIKAGADSVTPFKTDPTSITRLWYSNAYTTGGAAGNTATQTYTITAADVSTYKYIMATHAHMGASDISYFYGNSISATGLVTTGMLDSGSMRPSGAPGTAQIGCQVGIIFKPIANNKITFTVRGIYQIAVFGIK